MFSSTPTNDKEKLPTLDVTIKTKQGEFSRSLGGLLKVVNTAVGLLNETIDTTKVKYTLQLLKLVNSDIEPPSDMSIEGDPVTLVFLCKEMNWCSFSVGAGGVVSNAKILE